MVLADIPKREVIIVDDGSRDATWPTIERIAAKNHRVHGNNLMRNYGQHNALLRYPARALRRTVTIDDDLQHPPEELPKLLAALEDADVVYGRPEAEQHGFARDLASRMTKIALSAAMGARNATDVSAFRAFRTQLRDAFANYDGSYVVIDPMLAWGTQRFEAPSPSATSLAGAASRTTANLRKPNFYALNPDHHFQQLAAPDHKPVGFQGLHPWSVPSAAGLCGGPLSGGGQPGRRLPVPGLDHRDLLGSPAFALGSSVSTWRGCIAGASPGRRSRSASRSRTTATDARWLKHFGSRCAGEVEQPSWAQGHLADRNAGCILDRARDHRRHRDRARLAGPLDAERVEW